MSGTTAAYFLTVGFSLCLFISWLLEGHEFFNLVREGQILVKIFGDR